MPAQDLVTIAQAAKILGVSTKTLRRWEKVRKIKSLKTFGGHRRYPLSDLDFIKNKKEVEIPLSEPIHIIYENFHNLENNFHFIVRLISFVSISSFLMLIAYNPYNFKNQILSFQKDFQNLRVSKNIAQKPEDIFVNPSVLSEETGSNQSTGSQVSSLSSDLNLLINSSFEAGNINYEPKAWSYILYSGLHNTKVTNESVRTGNLSLKVESTSPVSAIGISQPNTTTINGRNYIFSVNIRTSNLVGTPTLRIGFLGVVPSTDPNYGTSFFKDYAADKFQDFTLTKNGTSNWKSFSFTYTNAALGKYPFVQISNYQGGKIYVDDLTMYELIGKEEILGELYKQLTNPIYQSITKIGDGSITVDASANIYPTIPNIGINIRGGLSVSGGLTISGPAVLQEQIQDTGGEVYNVKAYGAIGDGTTDDTSSVQSAITAATDANGGIIYFPPGTYLISSQLTIPNFTDTHIRQKTLRLTGAGPTNNFCCVSKGGSIIDLRASSGVAKIDTRGSGYLEIDHLTLKDGGTDSVPFVQTTNTVLYIHEVRFNGTASGTSASQDAIVLGGTSTTIDGSSNAAFQGYGTIIENNEFQLIRRGVYLRTYANGVVIRNNAFAGNSGTNLPGGAAIELDGGPNNDHGNVIANNIFEMTNYVYGIKLTAANNNNIEGNGFYDPTATTQAFYRFESSATQNMIIDGVHSTSYTTVSDASGNTNTLLTSNTGISSHFAGGVGIGTASPSEILTVSGGANPSTLGIHGDVNTNASLYLTETDNSAGTLLQYNGATNAFHILTGTAGLGAGKERLTILRDSGNIGIANTNPGTTLDFAAGGTARISHVDAIFGDTSNNRLSLASYATPSSVNSSAIQFFTADGATASQKAVLTGAGNFGIGITGPAEKLEVNGNIVLFDRLLTSQNPTNIIDMYDNGIAINSYLNVTHNLDNESTDLNEAYHIFTNATQSRLAIFSQDGGAGANAEPRIGFGSDSTPDDILDLYIDEAASHGLTIAQVNAGDFDPQIGFQLVDGTNTFTMGVDDSDLDKFKISTTALGTNDRLIIDTSGNLTLTGNLTVSGTGTHDFEGSLRIDAGAGIKTERLCQTGGGSGDGVALNEAVIGDCSAAGQVDFAEYYGSDGTLEAGDVVVADKGETNKAYVKASTTHYQPDLIGIVSTDPFVEILGEGIFEPSQNPVPIALSGRVPVKISQGSESVATGDFITSSNEPGTAMKATKAGYTIGKALEDWSPNSGKEKILVFVNLSWYAGALTGSGDFVPNRIADTYDPTSLTSLNNKYDELSTKVGSLEDELTLLKSSFSTLPLVSDSSSFGSLSVLGDTVLSDTVINGKLNVGILSFDDLEGSIDAIGPLKLQSMALDSIQLAGNTIEIDKNGNFFIKEGIISANDKIRGATGIEPQQNSVAVRQEWDAPPFSIQVTPSYKTSVWVTEISDKGFTINVSEAPASAEKLYWWAVW